MGTGDSAQADDRRSDLRSGGRGAPDAALGSDRQNVIVETTAHGAGESTAEVEAPVVAPPRGESVMRGLGLTLGAQIIVAACSLLLYRLLAVHTGTTGFASYSLVKQGVSLLFPVVTVGLVGGLPRYIALRHAQGGPPAESYLVSATVISGVVTVASIALALAIPALTATFLFGSSRFRGLVAPFAGLLGATAVFFLAYGYFRGQMRLDRSNGLQIVASGILPPLIVATLPGASIGTLIALMAIVLGVLSLLSILAPLVRGLVQHIELMSTGQTLLNYGSRRVPGEMAQLTLTAIVPILAAHVTTLRNVAYIAAGLQVTTLLIVALNPIGIVLLPALARNWVEDRERTSQQVGQLSSFAVGVGLFALGQMVLFADLAVRYWLGPRFIGAAAIVRVICLSVPLFAYYLALRSALDAAAVRSYNSASNIAALLAFAIFAALTLSLHLIDPALALAWAYSVGIMVRGLMTFFYVHRLFHLRATGYRLQVVIPVVLATVAVGLLARPVIRGSSAGLLLLCLLQLCLFVGFFGALFWLRIPWTRQLAEKVPWIGRATKG